METWDLYFASICSLRFHPRNDENIESYVKEVEFAAAIADLMMKERECRGLPPSLQLVSAQLDQ